MTQQPLLSLDQLLASLGGLTYMQLYYLSNTIAQIIPDEQAAMQFMRSQFALQSQENPVVTNEAADAMPSKDQHPMGRIVKSVLKLSQHELETLGKEVLNRLRELPFPFPKRDSESHAWGISYGLSQVFPEENFKPQIEATTEVPAAVKQIRTLTQQAFRTLPTNPEEALRLISEAIALAEQNRYPTFSIKINWESRTRNDAYQIADLFQEAVEFYRMQNDPFELATKLKDWAFMQARIENRDKAMEILIEAETILESLTPEALSEKQNNGVLFQNLIQNEIRIRTKLVEIQHLRKQILSGGEVRGGYSIGMI